MTNLSQLAALIRGDREPLLRRWREQVRGLPSAHDLDVPTLNDHIPALLEELARALEVGSDESIAAALREGSSPTHGLQRVKDAFNIAEVVAEYNILRGCVHDLAEGEPKSRAAEVSSLTPATSPLSLVGIQLAVP